MKECYKCFENGMLVLPTTFEECLTYEMQICWLKNYIDTKDGGFADAEVDKKLAELEQKVVDLKHDVEFADAEVDKKLEELEQKVVDLQHDAELLKPKNYVIPLQNVTDQFLDEDSLEISVNVIEFAGAEIVGITDYNTVDDLRSVNASVSVDKTIFSAEPFDLVFQGHIDFKVSVKYRGGRAVLSIVAPCEYTLSSDMKTATIRVNGCYSVLLSTPDSSETSDVTHRLYSIQFRKKTFTVNVEQREV